jgi:hypothetical protein
MFRRMFDRRPGTGGSNTGCSTNQRDADWRDIYRSATALQE